MDAETRALMPIHARAKQAMQLEKKRLEHIVKNHGDIQVEDILRAQDAVDDGIVIQPSGNPLKREFLLERDGYLWILPVKETPRTFFKIPLGTQKHKQFKKAKLKDGKVLRKQKRK